MIRSLRTRRAVLSLSVSLGVYLLALPNPGMAEPSSDPEKGILVASFENDIFSGNDSWYTNGFQFLWILPDTAPPDWVDRIARTFPAIEGEEGPLPWAVSLTQGIYTPEDITDPEFPPDDRPYAGGTAVGITTGRIQEQQLDRVSFHLGMVGPASGAGFVQRSSHRIMGADEPVGWETQLPNEPIALLGYERSRRFRLSESGKGGWQHELTPGLGGAIGNAFTEARGNLFYRVGRNIPLDFGPPRISPVPVGAGYFQPTAQSGWYFYSGMAVRYVLHNIFLDGSLFQDTPSVESEPWVGEWYSGVVWYSGDIRLAYTHVWRTPEFTAQEHSQRFGSISISWRF